MADNYNYDMQRLQQDAIRRAREMQSRAQMAAAPPLNRSVPRPPVPVPAAPVPPAAAQQNRSSPVPEHRAPAPPHLSTPAPAAAPAAQRQPPPQHDLLSGALAPVKDIFDILLSDSERTLIMALIVLLTEEKADPGVIFALMYLVI